MPPGLEDTREAQTRARHGLTNPQTASDCTLVVTPTETQPVTARDTEPSAAARTPVARSGVEAPRTLRACLLPVRRRLSVHTGEQVR